MGLATHRLRATLRSRGLSYLAVVVLLGITLGVSFAAIAGARRTQSAYPRFLRWGNASTLSLTSGGVDDPATVAEVARFPQVRASASYQAFQTNVVVHGRPDFTQNFEAVGTVDGRYFDQDRIAIVHGRAADPARADEVVANAYAAKQFGYRVGQRLDLWTWSSEQVQVDSFYAHPPPPKHRDQVTVVGIGLFSDEVLQDDGDRTTRLLLTPALSRRVEPYALYDVQGVILRHGDRDISRVKQRYEAIVPAGTSTYRVTSNDEYHALGAVRPLSIALGLFGAIAGVAGLLLAGQAVGRLVRLERRELAVLRAVGAGPRAVAASMLAAPALAILAGTLLALGIAVAMSPLFPLGPVRRVEVDRGVDLDLTVLSLGALAVVVALAVASVLVVRSELPHRLARRDHQRARPSRLVAAASAAGAPAPAVVGLRFALEPGDPGTAVPVRSVIPSAVAAVVALVASLTFGTNLATLVDRPASYGWAWDVTVIDANGYGNLTMTTARPVLARDPAVEAWSGAYFGTDLVGDADIPLIGMDVGSPVLPPILSGRAPRAADEVLLGRATAQLLGKGVGDLVNLGRGAGAHQVRVVGTATLPTVGILHGAHTSLGVGALVASHLVPGFDRDLTNTRTGPFGPNVLFIRLRPGADAAAARRRLERSLGPAADFGGIVAVGAQRPAEIVNSSSVGTAPTLLAATLALATMVSLGLALGASVRRRARDLALLKCLGFTRRQLSASVLWQATTTIAVSLVLGLPLGVALGRWSWIQFAHQLDIVPSVRLSPVVVVGVTAAVLVVANVAALLPARRAARVVAMTRTTSD